MAWQSLSGMGAGSNGGGNGGGDGSQQVNQPQGTEYTLQGVMRFLQTEWHRHERDRASSPMAMDSMIHTLLTILSILLASLVLITYHHRRFRKANHQQLPRATGALPIIGNLHQLAGGSKLLHKTLGCLADKHGPVFTIRLGSQENLVVSSWETAKECFTTLDKVFSDRPKTNASRILGYNYSMFGLAPYGPYWRELRRIATIELLSHRRIDMLHHIRASEVETSLKELYGLWATEGGLNYPVVVEMKRWFGDLTLNTFVRMVGGKRFVGGDEEERCKKVMRDFMYFFGVFVLSDAIPWLGWLDVEGHEKSMKSIAKELDGLMSKWLEEHIERMRGGEDRVDQDFMDVMLTIIKDVDFPQFDAHTIIKSTCLNMILAGSDTTMVTLTWALSLLLNNPHALRKAQDEVDTFVSKDRHVKESDINKLVYLDAVIKETLRLYPAAPLIGFHSSMEDCTISPGYHVPSGTRLMVNIWKIQRDGELWPEPLEFKPERFLTSHKDVDVRGKNFEFIPFGSGRRGCPGTALALRMVHLTLASLLHCYEFSRPDDSEIDMTESPGLTNLKATPLEVRISPRLRPQVFGVGLQDSEI